MNNTSEIKQVFSKLSHDLRNDFAVIRAVASIIQKKSPPSEMMDEKIETINETLDQAIKRLEIAYTLLDKMF